MQEYGTFQEIRRQVEVKELVRGGENDLTKWLTSQEEVILRADARGASTVGIRKGSYGDLFIDLLIDGMTPLLKTNGYHPIVGRSAWGHQVTQAEVMRYIGFKDWADDQKWANSILYWNTHTLSEYFEYLALYVGECAMLIRDKIPSELATELLYVFVKLSYCVAHDLVRNGHLENI
jgi:hypothetical protein